MISRSLFLCLMNLIGLRIGVPYPILRLSFQMKAVELLFFCGEENRAHHISRKLIFLYLSHIFF